MKKNHIFVPDSFIRAEQYTSPSAGGGGGGDDVPVRNRVAHANQLLVEYQRAAQGLEVISAARTEAGVLRTGGLYVQFTGTPSHALPYESLTDERLGIALLSTKLSEAGDVATVFIPANRLDVIERKIAAYRDSEINENVKPRNQRLVANLESVALAQVDALWTDDLDVLPALPDEIFWAELWLRNERDVEPPDEVAAIFIAVGIEQGEGQIEFPERLVLPVRGSRNQFGKAMLLLNSIAELRRMKETAAFFVGEQAGGNAAEWIDSLSQRMIIADQELPPRICLLDTGVNDHPLLLPAIASGGKHVIDPTWGAGDQDGHGTNMAGLCVFGDLLEALESQGPFVVGHQLESVKVLRWSGDNQRRLPGDVTREGIARAEISAANVNRAFVMALSSSDTRDKGRPSTWSSMVDKLASGADDGSRRLIFVAGGNVPRHLWTDYPLVNSTEVIHDPGQAWNALTIGAYTEKTTIDASTYPGWTVLAPSGGLGPSSSTSATWRGWPIKPDLVMEGGNAAHDPAGSVDTVESLDLLTTNHQFLIRPLQAFGDTSGATALAGRFAAQLFAHYPHLWPETVRALMVHSAEWTQAMLDRFVNSDPWRASKTDVRNLMRHCGHGVPNMESAIWSLNNALTLICQSDLQPFDEKFDADGKRDGYCTKDMNLHLIPWPKEALEALEETEVELRISLSYFIEPNPAERGWSGRYRYQSHGMRFAVKKGSENLDEFRHRVNAHARQLEGGEGGSDSDGWLIGDTTRSLGSLHADRWRGTARSLAERGVLAVFPTLGWWRERPKHQRWDHRARYALVVSILAPMADVDLFASIANQIAVPVEVVGS